MWKYFYVEQYLTLPRCRARYRRVTVLPYYPALWLLLLYKYIIKMRGEETYPASYSMKVLSVLSSNKGRAYPCLPEFCPL